MINIKTWTSGSAWRTSEYFWRINDNDTLQSCRNSVRVKKMTEMSISVSELDRKKFCRQNDLGAARIQEDSDNDNL